MFKTTPYTQYPLFSGYDVDPLPTKEVFTLENRSVFPKIPTEKSVGIGCRGQPEEKFLGNSQGNRPRRGAAPRYMGVSGTKVGKPMLIQS